MEGRKRYQRSIPSGRTKLITVNIHGRTVRDVSAALDTFSSREGARCYVTPDGQLAIAVRGYDA